MFEYKEKLDRLGKYLPTLVFVLALILLVDKVADMTWKLWPSRDSTANVAPATGVAQNTVRRAAPPAAVIASWHLFGQAATVNKAVPLNAPETTLRLTLKGVIASAQTPSAIIAAANGQEHEYSPGDSLPGGAKLREIYPDRVILERKGRYETLSLQRRELNKKELIINE